MGRRQAVRSAEQFMGCGDIAGDHAAAWLPLGACRIAFARRQGVTPGAPSFPLFC